MCSVSASPVMKMIGTWSRPASRFSRLQVSKPSRPGMTASSSTMSGVIWSTIRIAAAPSSATITVMPAPSSASVSSRSVSGESSTTRATSRFLDSVIIAVQCFEGRHVLIEIEAVDQRAHLRNEIGVFGIVAADLVELDLDRSDIAELSEADQFLDIFHRWPRSRLRFPARLGYRLGLVLPFDPEQLPDRLDELGDIDRLHQIAVVKWLRQRRAMRFKRARRHHQDAGLMMAALAQRFRHRPAVHAGHRDIQQEQIRPTVLRQREAAGSVGRAQENEAERRQHLAQEVAMGRIVVGNQNRLARAVIAEDRRLYRRDPCRMGDFRQQDLDAENAAFADLAGYLDVAAHHACQQPADGQPEPGAALRLRDAERTALERRENPFEIVGSNTGPGVDHLELGDRAAIMHDELHAAGLREF